MKKKKIGFAIMACFASLLFFCGVPLGNLYYSMATVNAAYMGEVSTAKQEADRLQSESAAAEAKKAEEEAKKQAEEDIKTQEEEKKKRDAEIAAAAKKAAEAANRKPANSYKPPTEEDKKEDTDNRPSGGAVPVIPDDDSSNGSGVDTGTVGEPGWQTIDGKKYYFDSDGKAIVGPARLDNTYMFFDSDGVLQNTSLGIDVSYHNGKLDWKEIKSIGVEFAMIRVGYRGYGAGTLVYDEQYKNNIKGALDNGIKVGVYFFSQAISAEEGIEEASFVLDLIQGYNITLPVCIDTETSGGNGSGRADKISVADRTAAMKGFCETIAAAGKKPMIYASTSWFYSHLDMSQLPYMIWQAQWMSQPNYKLGFDIWQFTSNGSLTGDEKDKRRFDLNFIFN